MEFTSNKNTLTPPSERFCLLDLDENEYYLKSLNVVMNNFNSEEFVPGILHLNSRSMIFDSDNEALPLIKIRYNSHFEFEWISHGQIKALYDSIVVNKSSLSNLDSSNNPRRSADGDLSKGSPRKKETKNLYSKKSKGITSGKSLTSYLDKRPSFKSFPKSKTGSGKVIKITL